MLAHAIFQWSAESTGPIYCFLYSTQRRSTLTLNQPPQLSQFRRQSSAQNPSFVPREHALRAEQWANPIYANEMHDTILKKSLKSTPKIKKMTVEMPEYLQQDVSHVDIQVMLTVFLPQNVSCKSPDVIYLQCTCRSVTGNATANTTTCIQYIRQHGLIYDYAQCQCVPFNQHQPEARAVK